jgi:hypothetical protein
MNSQNPITTDDHLTMYSQNPIRVDHHLTTYSQNPITTDDHLTMNSRNTITTDDHLTMYSQNPIRVDHHLTAYSQRMIIWPCTLRIRSQRMITWQCTLCWWQPTASSNSLFTNVSSVVYESKVSRYSHEGANRERKYSSYSFLTSTLYWGQWSASSPGRALPLERTPVRIG